jgi:hypothetical protein
MLREIKMLDSPAKKATQVKGFKDGFDLLTNMAEHIYMFGCEGGRSETKLLPRRKDIRSN